MTRPLIHLAEVDLGRQRSPEHERGDHMVRYLRSANVGDGTVVLDDVKEMNFSPREQATFALRDGDVLVTEGSGSRETVGQSGVWREQLPGVVCFQNTLLRIRPRTGMSDGRYLAWWARHAHASRLMAAVASGANILHLSAEELRRLPVPDLEIATQRRIADLLDDQVARIDNIIAARRAQLTLIDTAVDSEIDSMFGVVPLSSGARLGRFLIRIEQGWSPQCATVPAGDYEWGVLKVSAVKRGHFNPDENKRLPDDLQAAPAYEVKENDLLVTRANTPSLVGMFAVVPPGTRRRLIMSDKIMRLTLDGSLDPQFVAYSGRTMSARAQLTGAGTGTSQSMVNIRGDDIRDLRIRALALVDQKALVSAAQASEAQFRGAKTQLMGQASRFEELKRSLITAAVTGEFDVSSADGSRVGV